MAASSHPTVTVASDRIGFFDLQRQQRRIHDDVRQRMDAVLAHGQFILGPEVGAREPSSPPSPACRMPSPCRAAATR